jgi:hypothetical protein
MVCYKAKVSEQKLVLLMRYCHNKTPKNVTWVLGLCSFWELEKWWGDC